MTVLIVANVKPKDPDKMAAYAEAAAETLPPYGGAVLHRGAFHSALAGETGPHGLGILRFPDAQKAAAWYTSDAYQAIVPLREEAAEMTLTLYELAG